MKEKARIGWAGSAMALSLMLAACGGGGGVNSTPTPVPAPTPVPTPTPTPTPTPSVPPQALGVSSGTTNFAALSTHTTQQLLTTDDTVTSTSTERAGLTFSYDAGSGVYSVSGSGVASTFGKAEFLGYDNIGDAQFYRDVSGGQEFLTLFNPQRLGRGTQKVTLGLWQKRTNGGSDFAFDVFVYGVPTATTGVPRVGSATYDIDLFAVASPIGSFPRSVIGNGTFSLDFAHGLFAMSGEAGEYNNDVNYSTCCTEWHGAGYLASTGGLTGYFTYAGRDRYTYQASILGALYGPVGADVAGSLHGSDGADATFSGAFAGTRERIGIDASLTVLDSGERSYYSFQGSSIAFQRIGATSSEGGTYYFPATYGSVSFKADGSLTPMFGISDPSFTNVTFRPTDKVAAQSDARFDVYQVRNSNGDYRLEMFRPGPGNPEINLTYSSFGHWSEDRAIADAARQSISTWFTYGVRTVYNSLPRTGSAHYSATVMGSGERFADMEQLALKGTSSIDADFAAERISGTVNVDAWTSANEMIDLPVMTFDSSSNAYAFDTFLYDAPGHSDGSIRGSLYGPGGDEIGGTFEFFTRVTGGWAPDATYSGVFYGKRD
ncbi:MAG: hypothetical protein J7493_10100 [Porphyrobacter sp.]|nr:hypothetical protein [Porphyrobacter sp.]